MILFSVLAYLVHSDTMDEYSKGIFSETPLQWLANGCYCPLICNQWGRHVLLTPTYCTFKLFILNSCFESLPSVHFVCHCNLALGTVASSEVHTGPPNYVYSLWVFQVDSRYTLRMEVVSSSETLVPLTTFFEASYTRMLTSCSFQFRIVFFTIECAY